MKTTKNDKRQILSSKKTKFVSFFVRFVRVSMPFHQLKSGPENHGSILVLLLGCALCVADMQHVALADWGSNDAATLARLYEQVEQDATNFRQLSDGSTLAVPTSSAAAPVPNLFTGRGSSWWTSDTRQNNGPNFGYYQMSMLQVLDIIGMFTGGVTTNGYYNRNNITLPQLILGWNRDSPGSVGHSVYTNGVLGRIDALRESMESIADKTEEYQNSVTGLLQNIAGQMSAMANNQTNILYSIAPPYGEDWYSDFLSEGFSGNHLTGYALASLLSMPQTLAFSVLPLGDDFGAWSATIGEDTLNFVPQLFDTPYPEMQKAFYKYYGNYATYDSAFGQDNTYGQYEFEGSSNIVNQTRATRPALTNDNPRTLLPIQGIPELSGDVTDFISIKNDYSNLTGPSQAEITKWSGYFENTVAESQETAGFKFGITFAGVGSEEVSIETEDVDFFESINLQRISQIGNTWIRYGVSIVKGLLMLLFVWSVAEKAVGIFINNGMQAG